MAGSKPRAGRRAGLTAMIGGDRGRDRAAQQRPSLIACRTGSVLAPRTVRAPKKRTARRSVSKKWSRPAPRSDGNTTVPGTERSEAVAQDRRERPCRPPKLDRATRKSNPAARSAVRRRAERNLPMDMPRRSPKSAIASRPTTKHRDAAGVTTRDRRDRRSVAEYPGWLADLTHSNLTRAEFTVR